MNAAPAKSAATLVLLLLSASPAAAAPWTLERVLAAARERDPAVHSARAAGAAGRAEARQAWALLSPRVTLGGGFTRADDPAMLFSQKLWQGRFTPADFAVDRLNQPVPTGALQWGITIDQPLWNGGRELRAPALAGHAGRAATAAERAAVAGRLLVAVESYVGAARAVEAARAALQDLGAAEAVRAAATERWRMGQVPELDTLRAAVRLRQARVRELASRSGLAVALRQLSGLVGAEVRADDLAPLDEPPALPAGAAPGRPELAAAREGAAAAESRSRTAALRLLPSVNSRLTLNTYSPVTRRAFEERWMVAVLAELPLFDGGQRVAEWRAARARALEARAGAQALARDLDVALESARAADAVAGETRESARAGRAAAEEALRLATLRYGSGLLPLTELLATDAEASGARAAEVEAAAALVLARYRLLHALGELR